MVRGGSASQAGAGRGEGGGAKARLGEDGSSGREGVQGGRAGVVGRRERVGCIGWGGTVHGELGEGSGPIWF